MTELMWGLAAAVLVGSGATLVMDVWGLVWQHLLGVAPLNYALVGRWVLYLGRGRLRHTRRRRAHQQAAPTANPTAPQRTACAADSSR